MKQWKYLIVAWNVGFVVVTQNVDIISHYASMPYCLLTYMRVQHLLKTWLEGTYEPPPHSHIWPIRRPMRNTSFSLFQVSIISFGVAEIKLECITQQQLKC